MYGVWKRVTIGLILALGLFYTGCSEFPQNETLKNWSDVIKLLPEEEKNSAPVEESPVTKTALLGESVDVELYFITADGMSLEAEKRTIPKSAGIARKTIEELIKGPGNKSLGNPLPVGTELLDINIKPDGLCIVNLSSAAKSAEDPLQEKMLVYAVTNTLGQFPTVKQVTFMIEGEEVEQLGGNLDLSSPIKPDYNL